MNRLTIAFLSLLALATLSAGSIYQSVEVWISGHGGMLTLLTLTASTALFGASFFILARVVKLTTRVPNR